MYKVHGLKEYFTSAGPHGARRHGSGHKVPTAILSTEKFSQNFLFLGSAILRNQSSMSLPKII